MKGQNSGLPQWYIYNMYVITMMMLEARGGLMGPFVSLIDMGSPGLVVHVARLMTGRCVVDRLTGRHVTIKRQG